MSKPGTYASVAAVAAIFAFGPLACGGDDGKTGDDGNPLISIDGAADIGFGCNGTTGVYSTRHGKGVAVLGNDPECGP